MATVKIDKNNFKSDVLDAKEAVVVDFWAEWCGPCKMIAPALEEISKELTGKVKIAKLNIDENPELAAQYGVRSIPTLMMFKGGEIADMKVGARPRPPWPTGSTATSSDPTAIWYQKPGLAPGFLLAIARAMLAFEPEYTRGD